MILDEAIKHAEEVAKEYSKYNICGWDERASEHRQLAEWLKELKMYREMIPSASEVFLAEIRKETSEDNNGTQDK